MMMMMLMIMVMVKVVVNLWTLDSNGKHACHRAQAKIEKKLAADKLGMLSSVHEFKKYEN